MCFHKFSQVPLPTDVFDILLRGEHATRCVLLKEYRNLVHCQVKTPIVLNFVCFFFDVKTMCVKLLRPVGSDVVFESQRPSTAVYTKPEPGHRDPH